MLGRRHAIVLSGHLHKYSILDRATPAGQFTQLAVCSVVRADHAPAREERTGLDAYSPALLDLEPKFEPATRAARQRMLEDEHPSIRRFEYADLPGFAVVDVYEKQVACRVFGGLDETPYRAPSLTAAAHA